MFEHCHDAKLSLIEHLRSTGLANNMSIKTGREKLELGTARLPSLIPALDAFLGGGFPFGAVSECGMPLGMGGRYLLLKFLAQAAEQHEPPLWVLWISSHQDLEVYPPAWVSFFNLQNSGHEAAFDHIIFAYSEKPVQDLKRALARKLFQVVIMDAPPKLDHGECSFISQNAREQKQAVIIVRDFLLSNKRGNVWATLRMNCVKNSYTRQYVLQAVRGLSKKILYLDEDMITRQKVDSCL